MIPLHLKLPLALTILMAGPAFAQAPVAPKEVAPPIQDNSFLIEEAYNQPAGVVQHISTFAMDRKTRSWAYTFTQEWPVLSQLHQLSYTIPIERPESRLGTGIGDAALNYRYQMPTGRYTDLAVAPRLSMLVPTGAAGKGRGAGGPGIQANLPVSVLLAKSIVSHSNAGMTYTPRAENLAGARSATRDFNIGQSLIWLVRPTLNFMLEVAWESGEEVIDAGRRERSRGLLLSPGIRGAINLSSGLQIVPGIAVPIGVGPSRGERSMFFYLSLEHPFAKTAQKEME